MTAVLRSEDGATIPLDVNRWRAEVDDVELQLLAGLPDPVLDIGCGPGRIPAALARHGRMALGIDPAPAAESEARRLRAPFLRRSVFRGLPGEGRWGSVLLLDGNIGIGGDPVHLLRRCASLVRAGGQIVAEVDMPGSPTAGLRVRVEHGPARGPWFRWAVVGADDWGALAAGSGLRPMGLSEIGGRWFARAEPA